MTKKTIPEITIASRMRAETLLTTPAHGYRNVISIGGVGDRKPEGFLEIAPARRLRLEFDDVDPADLRGIYMGFDYRAASSEQVASLIAFCRKIDGKTLIHCAAGISRSAASACILAAIRLGPGREIEALGHVRRLKADIRPNTHVLRLADKALGCGGKLVLAHGQVFEGTRRILMLRDVA